MCALIISFVVIGYGKIALDDINSKANINLDCTKISFKDETKVEIEYSDPTLTSKQKTKTYCFCIDKLFNLGFSKTSNYKFPLTQKKPCTDIVDQYLLYTGFAGGVSIMIPLLNAVMIMLFTKITVFERNKTLTDDMKSVMAKVFLASFINTVSLLYFKVL